MSRAILSALAFIATLSTSHAQTIQFQGRVFEISNVKASVVEIHGEKALRVERDLEKLGFDPSLKSAATVDEPTFVKLQDVDFTNGTIGVKVLSRLLKTAPPVARGFIGVAFRIEEQNAQFDAIYLRPTNGRADDQLRRNHTIQYFSYPNYKFDKLRQEEYNGQYETYADIGLDEWIDVRIEIKDKKALLYLNDQEQPAFLINEMLGNSKSGSIGLWVDIGTEGYFKDLKVSPAGRDADGHDLPQLRRIFQPPHIVNKTPYGANEKAGKYVQAGDARIYYEVYGSGPPIVLLHGGGLGSTIEMANFIDHLKSDHQVIAISTRGHGKSEIGNAPLSYEQKANDVMAVVNAVTEDDVMVLGFSDGTYTGYKVASMYPERVRKLVAIGAGEQVPGLRKVVLDTKAAYALDSAYWKQQLALMPEPGRWQELWTQMADFYNSMTASKALFNSIKCPVLLVSGELDRNAPLPTIINAYNMIPNCQLSIVPNAGHVVFLENWQAVWASVAPFLKA